MSVVNRPRRQQDQRSTCLRLSRQRHRRYRYADDDRFDIVVGRNRTRQELLAEDRRRALTGARTAEIALAPARLVVVGDFHCLDLRKAGRKTSAAPRLVPLLPDLLKMGLLGWATKQEARGYALVQPDAKPMPRDLEYVAQADAILTRLSRLDPAYRLYTRIKESAQRSINMVPAAFELLEER